MEYFPHNITQVASDINRTLSPMSRPGTQ